MQDSLFIGPDVHKATISFAVTQGKRRGEVHSWGMIANRPDQVRRLAEKLASDGRRLHFAMRLVPAATVSTGR